MKRMITRYSYVNDRLASVDGRPISLPARVTAGDAFLTALYRALRVDYPRFFKMDTLSKLGFLSSELIFETDTRRFDHGEEIAILCFNRGSSLETDTRYQATIEREDAYYPSPSLFVYTLPNIVTAEIAIREKLHGETAFYIQETFDARQIFAHASEAFTDAGTRAVLAAWIESYDVPHEAFMMLIGKNDDIFDAPQPAECIVELLNKSRHG